MKYIIIYHSANGMKYPDILGLFATQSAARAYMKRMFPGAVEFSGNDIEQRFLFDFNEDTIILQGVLEY